MLIEFRPMDADTARTVVDWRYPAPYDLYNMATADPHNDIGYLTDPENGVYAMRNGDGALVGFCSFGHDGQVLGGDYSAAALDVGMGLHPDRTGQGRGAHYAFAALDYARRQFRPPAFRVTVAAFNRRALRTVEKAGFRVVQAFDSESDARPFVILMRPEPPVAIREFVPGEGAALKALRSRALALYPEAFGQAAADWDAIPLDEIERRIHDSLADDERLMLGAFAGETPQGMIGFIRERGAKNRHRGFIWGMYTAPEVQGQGIGRALLEEVLLRARTLPGLEQVNLGVVPENRSAVRLYEACGFATVAVEPRVLKVDGRYLAMAYMSHRFPAAGDGE